MAEILFSPQLENGDNYESNKGHRRLVDSTGNTPPPQWGALEPLMAELVGWLSDRGYALTATHNIVRATLRLGEWISRDHITSGPFNQARSWHQFGLITGLIPATGLRMNRPRQLNV